MLHDQGQDLDAAATIDKLVHAIDAGKVSEAELGGEKPKECPLPRLLLTPPATGRPATTPSNAANISTRPWRRIPQDLDVLIDLLPAPGQTPEYHAKIVDDIKKAALPLQLGYRRGRRQPRSAYNYAWLIGNTEGRHGRSPPRGAEVA